MRWTRGPRSENLEDRRGESPGGGFRMGMGGAKLGIGGAIVLLVLSLVTGQDFLSMMDGGTPQTTGTVAPADAPPAQTSAAEEEMVDFVSFVLDDIQGVWQKQFAGSKARYRDAKLVLFRTGIHSGCGAADAGMGPFYCPADGKVYVDLRFYELLKQRFGASGDFAEAYVIAHEIGHHVQNLLGISRDVREKQAARADLEKALSVRLELQADCLAGVWAHSTAKRELLESGDIEEAMNAAAAVGDDNIQRRSTGHVDPESWTHGSSEQRATWFRRGMESGRLEACDTFRS